MKYIPPKFSKLSEMSAIDVGRLTEDEARKVLEDIRWGKTITCPHCQSQNITRIAARGENIRDGLIQCNGCRKQFTVMIGTVMQGSHITLRQWVQGFHSMCSHKKGVSALQLQRNLGLRSYRSAWYLAHRIRESMSGALPLTLKGTIEADETYIGGKPRNITPKAKIKGMPKTDKTPVLAIIERNGNALSKPIPNITMDTLQGSIRAVVDHDSTIITDEFPSYYGVGYDFSGGHKVVNHRRREYVRGDIYTNTGESYFALLKRGVHGTFHHISVKHLSRYCNEFSFRWDNRKIDDGNRTVAAVRGMVGKRLKYKALTKQAA